MGRFRRRAAALTIALGLAVACRGDRPPAWPPGVQQVSDESPALSPDAALRTFFLPPGYRLELVASEPLIADPVWLDVDPEGRLWVVEMRGFMPDNAARGEREPVGRVVVLEDADDDGRADRSTVFLDGLVLPRSVKVLEHGVLVGAPPHLWLARDTDGDLRADAKEAVREDYGQAEGNPEHNANGLLWGMDNWIYTSEHDGHLRLRRGRWEHRPTIAVGQWGLSMDDEGRVYRNWNDDPLRVDLFPPRYFMRNPGAARTRGIYERVSDDTTVWPARPNPGVNRGYRDGTLHPDGSLAVFASAGTPVVYRGDRLPAELHGNVFVSEPAGNLVRRFVVREGAGGVLEGRNAYERAEFVTSTDERFRPVNLVSAPDGTLYIVDMYRGVIQHRQYQSEYLKHHIHRHGLDRPTGRGRIYRVVHETTRRAPRPALSRLTPAELAAVLEHPNGWWRDTAQRLIVERGGLDAVRPLQRLARSARDARTRLHALWSLEGLEALDEELVAASLGDPSAAVRAAAVRLAEPWLAEPGHPLQEAVGALSADESPAVRRQLALSLGELPRERRTEVLARVLIGSAEDPVAVDAAISGLHGLEMTVLERLLSASTGGASPPLDAVRWLAAAAVRGEHGDAADRLLQLVGDRRLTAAVRQALMEGASLAVAPSRETPLPPRDRPPRLAFESTPRTLIALASDAGDPLSGPAARVLSLADWPGKPAVHRQVPPLGEEEQRRFEAGQRVYGATCAACHMEDGRGREGIAPSLAGSRWVLGSPGLLARIVMHGREGAMLMPPVNLRDPEVAAVLTYVRRAWGNTASPVEETLIREVRGASTGRAAPWTDAELEGVTQPDGWPPPGHTH